MSYNKDLERILIELDQRAEKIGKCRCGTCGYTWRSGQNGSHICSQHMIPVDVLREIISRKNVSDNEIVEKIKQLVLRYPE